MHDLVSKVAIAIVNLHYHGWAHQEIRLENICFTNEYQPIFIDLDRVCAIERSPVIYPKNFLTCDTQFSRSDCESVNGQHPRAKLRNLQGTLLRGDTFKVGITFLTAVSSSRPQCDDAC